MALEVIAATVTVYRCPYCWRRHWHSRQPAERHLASCFNNPHRVPRLGELWPGKCYSEDEPGWAPDDSAVWDGTRWRAVRMDDDGSWPLVHREWRTPDIRLNEMAPLDRIEADVLAQVLLEEGAD